MTITHQGGTLRVSGLEELAAANCGLFFSALAAELQAQPGRIEIDLSRTEFMDCDGLGTLIALRNNARAHNHAAVVRLIAPAASVKRLLQLTKLDQVFPLDQSSG